MLRAVDDVLEEIGAGRHGRGCSCSTRSTLLDAERRDGAALPPPATRSLVSRADRRGPGGARASAIERRVPRARCGRVELLVPYAEGGRLAELHDVAGDLEREDTAEGVRVRARVPAAVAERFERFAVAERRGGRPAASGPPSSNGSAARRRDRARELAPPAPDAVLPARAHDGDAGFDLLAVEAVTLAPGERASVGTGIAVEIPPGHAGLVLPRSGLAARHGDRARQRARG